MLLARNFTTKGLHKTVPDAISWIPLFSPISALPLAADSQKDENKLQVAKQNFFFKHGQIFLSYFKQ